LLWGLRQSIADAENNIFCVQSGLVFFIVTGKPGEKRGVSILLKKNWN
jgi:hypothetical protein